MDRSHGSYRFNYGLKEVTHLICGNAHGEVVFYQDLSVFKNFNMAPGRQAPEPYY